MGKKKPGLMLDEAQSATLAVTEMFDTLHELFDPLANVYPKAHTVTKNYLKALDVVRALKQSLELEVESFTYQRDRRYPYDY